MKFLISTQGINKECKSANGSYDPVDYEFTKETLAIEFLEKITLIKIDIDFSSGDVCPPGFLISINNKEKEAFYIDVGKIFYTDTETATTPDEILKIALGELKFDMQKVRKDKYVEQGLKPLRKPNVLPTDKDNIKKANIDTSSHSPQFQHEIYKSSGWREAANTAPWAVGAFFLFIGLVIMGEKRDAEYAPIMFLIAFVCFLTFIPWRKLAKTTLTFGIDWKTNTVWILRKDEGVTGFEPDANMIIDFGVKKYTTKTSNPIWIMDPATPMAFNKKEWFITVNREGQENEWTFKGSSLAGKKEAIKIAEKANKLLNSQM